MTIPSLIATMIAGYVAGLFGCMRGMLRDTGSQPKSKNSLFMVFLWLFVVLSYWPLQIFQIAVAVTLVLCLDGGNYVLLKTCGICFVSGFVLMRSAPVIARIYQAIVTGLK